MNFSWILFDLDNTLLDFDAASKEAFIDICPLLGIVYEENYYTLFNKINHDAWKEFEDGEISLLELRSRRFENFQSAIGHYKMDGLEANHMFIQKLIGHSQPYSGVMELLSNISKKAGMSVITNGLKEAQRPRLDRTNLSTFFNGIYVSDEMGVAKPSNAYFEQVFDNLPKNIRREKVLVVGDSLKSDVEGGNYFGCTTCWISHGKSNETGIVPDIVIDKVDLLLDAI